MHRPDTQPRDDIWHTCHKCATPLLPLRDFEIHKSSESPGVGADLPEFILFGWWAFVINYVDDLFSFGSRQKRLAALKSEVLPQFPRSQVCPRCLELKRLP